MNRRDFIIAACACAACPLAGLGADKRAESGPVEIGMPSDFPNDGVYDDFAKEHHFFIVREKGKLFALSAICTHKKALLKLKDGALACPKHGARFSFQGNVVKAPAKQPLRRLGISVNDSGKIAVDPSISFEKKRWSEEGSFIATG